MSISLTPQLAGFVRTAVNSGLYNNASEVMREALRHLKQDRDRELHRLTVAEDRKETRHRIEASLASVRRGAYKDYDADGLRALVRRIVAEVGHEKTTRTKRS